MHVEETKEEQDLIHLKNTLHDIKQDRKKNIEIIRKTKNFTRNKTEHLWGYTHLHEDVNLEEKKKKRIPVRLYSFINYCSDSISTIKKPKDQTEL